MEMIDLIAAVCLCVITVGGFFLKRHTKRALDELDGLGEIRTDADAESDGVAKF